MKGLVIKRHDDAVRAIMKPLARGSLGNLAILADVNPTALAQPLIGPRESFLPKRLPAHLRKALLKRLRAATRSHTPSPADNAIIAAFRDKYGNICEPLDTFLARTEEILPGVSFRPDICVFHGGCRGTAALWADDRWTGYVGSTCVVRIVELGYAREGCARAKQEEKRGQHVLLELLLRELHYAVHYHTITLGVAGTVYVDALTTLTALGLSSAARQKVVTTWVHTALNLTHALVVCRQQLDGHLIAQAFARPP